MRFAHAIILTTLLSIASFGQAVPIQPAEPASDKIEDVYLARDNGSGKAGDVAETFTTADVPIYCVVMLAIMEPISVKMNFVAVKVPGVKAESKVVSAAYTTRQGQDRVFFSGRPDGTWVAGTYRIDIFVADKKERSLTFEISGNAAPAAAARFAPARPVKRPN
jgi:hypothetical protein